MAQLNLIFVFVLMVFLVVAEAGTRIRRSPQFGQASASAVAFGGSRFPPRPGFGGPGFGGPGFGGPGFGGPGFAGPGLGGPGFGRPGFGNPGFDGRGFGGPGGFGRPGFGGPSFGRPGFGGPGFGSSPGLSINVAKSVSISAGRGGNSLSSANAFSRG
ncbi:unnamed protein product [Euphydryas editha]|uniref:Uncharacterized protein n=1 Tax=Euphydryas editha TaxID=104508 RepID=A0AAU9UYF5_EUPED|nr:unnamed protein product [Euphydryas editha]